MDSNVDANNIDIDTIDINIDISNNDVNNIVIDINTIDLSNYRFSFFDEKVFLFKIDRNNILMSSHFACTHVFDPNFSNLLSKFYENAEINRIH